MQEVPTTIMITTSQDGDGWRWSVTCGEGDQSQRFGGKADGPHQASEAAIIERERLIRQQEEKMTHYHNEYGDEIVIRKHVRHDHPLRNGIETVWVQWSTGDAFTYIRKVDVAMMAEGMINGTITRHGFTNLINSF